MPPGGGTPGPEQTTQTQVCGELSPASPWDCMLVYTTCTIIGTAENQSGLYYDFRNSFNIVKFEGQLQIFVLDHSGNYLACCCVPDFNCTFL